MQPDPTGIWKARIKVQGVYPSHWQTLDKGCNKIKLIFSSLQLGKLVFIPKDSLLKDADAGCKQQGTQVQGRSLVLLQGYEKAGGGSSRIQDERSYKPVTRVPVKWHHNKPPHTALFGEVGTKIIEGL